MGDFDGDGIADLVTLKFAPGGVTNLLVMLGSDDGTFSAPVSTLALPGTLLEKAWKVGPVTGDFNGDGRDDVAVAISNYEDILVVAFPEKDGSIHLFESYAGPAGAVVSDIQVGQLAGHDHLDIVFALDGDTDNVALFEGNGDGTFAAKYTTSSASSDPLVLGDFTGNKKTDIVLGVTPFGFELAPLGSDISVLTANTDGDYDEETITSLGLARRLSGLVKGDFDGDGVLDLVALYAGAASAERDSRMFTLRGGGNGTFTIAESYSYDESALGAARAADLNGDGKLDLAITQTTHPFIHVWLGNGDLSFTPSTSVTPTGALFYPKGLTLKDLNGDGLPDIIMAASNSGAGVFLNTTPKP
jgi:hypothetical protein